MWRHRFSLAFQKCHCIFRLFVRFFRICYLIFCARFARLFSIGIQMLRSFIFALLFCYYSKFVCVCVCKGVYVVMWTWEMLG